MGLFVRKTTTNSTPPLYSIGAEKTILLVGLGNFGKEYNDTRHNIGFECLDAFAEVHSFSGWNQKKSLKADLAQGTINGTRVILIKPTTYMNNSGEAVKATQQFYKISNAQTVVLHDELDIPFGTVKTKQAGGSAGHNGLKSIIAHCGEDFGRVRIGIANDFSGQADSADFVLGMFTKDEQKRLPEAHKVVTQLLDHAVTDGFVHVTTTQF